MEQPVTLRIKRTRSKGSSYWQDFHVTLRPEDYVLDALEAAWKQDPSLLFRHSCHHASCGSCGMRIQGREALACVTRALQTARRGVLRLEPLRNFPVIADLVVDTGDLARKLERVQAHTVNEDGPALRFENCIECGLCISACPISATSRPYLGPAVLAAARPNLHLPQVRAQVESREGVWRCHGAFECTEVCPAGVDPAGAIILLRQQLVRSLLQKGE